MELNIPAVLAEVTQAFECYERALTSNDIETLNQLFWDSAHTLRYGIAEQLYGHAAIAAYRSRREPSDLERSLTQLSITTYGRDFATANCEYRRTASGRFGRQSQTWLRTDQGWRIVAAHVSLFDAVLPSYR